MPHKPVLGITGIPTFDPQFSVATLDIRSFASTPIEYFDRQGNVLADMHATGFFYRLDGRTFLVSARHAITGLDTFTDEVISKTGYLPYAIRVFPHTNKVMPHHRLPALTLATRNAVGEALWQQDPDFQNLRTDISCIEITSAGADTITCINDAQDEDLFANVGFDCFIIGYPNRSYHDPYLPIWRRGSLAYEPFIPVDNKPMFLVDGMTSRGMSGSAIVQRWHGPAPLNDGKGGITVDLDKIVCSRLIGVYGGRLSAVAELAEVGFGWYANRIPLIAAAPVGA